jgi:hypothetical protein
VTAFNNRHLPEQYLKNDWKLTFDYAKYEESSDDDVSWENNYDEEKKPVFTHAISGFKPNQFKLMRNTPFGNSLTFEFAKAAIEGDTGQPRRYRFLGSEFFANGWGWTSIRAEFSGSRRHVPSFR